MGRELTYGQIDQLSAAFCAYPQQFLGVRKGDRIAVMLPNYAAFPLAFLGVTRAGAIQVHENRLYTARDLAHQLRDAGCETIVIFNGATPTLAEIIAETPIKNVITVAPGDGLGFDAPPAGLCTPEKHDLVRHRAGRRPIAGTPAGHHERR